MHLRGCESSDFNATSNTLASHIYNIISINFLQNYELLNYPNKYYNRIRMVIDFLSSLNDRDAIDLYQGLKGFHV